MTTSSPSTEENAHKIYNNLLRVFLVFVFLRLSSVRSFVTLALCLCALVEDEKQKKKRLLFVETRFFFSLFGGIVLLPSMCKYVWKDGERKIAHALIALSTEFNIRRKKSQCKEDLIDFEFWFFFFCVNCFKRFEQYLNCVQSER